MVHFKCTTSVLCVNLNSQGRIQRGTGGPDPYPEKSQKYRVSLQYWSRSPEKSKSYQASINVWPSLARQRNAIEMAFRLRADNGPLIAVVPYQLKEKSCQIWTPSEKKLSRSAHGSDSSVLKQRKFSSTILAHLDTTTWTFKGDICA